MTGLAFTSRRGYVPGKLAPPCGAGRDCILGRRIAGSRDVASKRGREAGILRTLRCDGLMECVVQPCRTAPTPRNCSLAAGEARFDEGVEMLANRVVVQPGRLGEYAYCDGGLLPHEAIEYVCRRRRHTGTRYRRTRPQRLTVADVVASIYFHGNYCNKLGTDPPRRRV